MILFKFCIVGTSALFCFNGVRLESGHHASNLAIYTNVILGIVLLLILLLLTRQPQSTKELSFKVTAVYYKTIIYRLYGLRRTYYDAV